MPAETESGLEDRRTYAAVGVTLLAGLLLSIAVMVAGLVAVAISGGDTSKVLALDQILPQLGRGSAPAILDGGILLLFATPLAGVVVALGGLILKRDWLFAGTTGLLLAMLVIAFAIALH